MSVLIAASVVLCSVSVVFGRNTQWLDRTDTRWLLSLQLIILMLAVQSPNIWITIIICWITLHPWVVHIHYSYGPLQFAPDRNSVYEPLFPVLWWTALYITLTLHPISWQLVAWTLITWATINALFALYQDHYAMPHFILDDRTPQYPSSPGLLGGSFLLSFTCAMASLSTAFIIYTSHNYYLTPLLIVLSYASLRTGTISPLLSVTIPFLLFLTTTHIYYYLLILCIISLGLAITLSHYHVGSINSRLPAWRAAIHMCNVTHYLGIGLGAWNAFNNPPDVKEQEGLLWRNLHNDWLQSIVELSPLPSVCAILLLMTQWTSLFHHYPNVTLDTLYGLLMVSSLSLYAIVYFPMRDHMPAILLAVSLSMLR